MSDDTYNGWCNRETWATALHLSNDQDLYDISRRLVREADADAREFMAEHDLDSFTGGLAADRIQEWITDAANELLHAEFQPTIQWRSSKWIRMLLSDVGSLWRVDWYAVADSFRD